MNWKEDDGRIGNSSKRWEIGKVGKRHKSIGDSRGRKQLKNEGHSLTRPP